MRPTIDDQVEGARRLLSGVVDGGDVPDAVRETLVNVRRLLDQIGRSWAALPGFYAEDNAVLSALLARVGAVVPDAVTAQIAATLARPVPAATAVRAAAEYNAQLRGLLSTALRELPADSAGASARAQIAGYLRRRVDADPA